MERITGKTLAQATTQQIFDQSVGGIITQGCKSLSNCGDACMYRSPQGNACAAGQLLSDDEASLADNLPYSTSWECVVLKGIAANRHSHLITGLQGAHDSCKHVTGESFVTEFKNHARRVGIKYALDTSIIDR